MSEGVLVKADDITKDGDRVVIRVSEVQVRRDLDRPVGEVVKFDRVGGRRGSITIVISHQVAVRGGTKAAMERIVEQYTPMMTSPRWMSEDLVVWDR